MGRLVGFNVVAGKVIIQPLPNRFERDTQLFEPTDFCVNGQPFCLPGSLKLLLVTV